MKKLFTLIAVALCTLGANAEVTTDVSTFKNYIYVDAEGTCEVNGNTASPATLTAGLTAGKQGVVRVLLKHDGAAQSLGYTVCFPDGYEPKGQAVVVTNWAYEEDVFGGKTYALAGKDQTIVGSTIKTGLLGGGTSCNYIGDNIVVAAIAVVVPADATTPAVITVKEGEVSVTEAYKTANNFEYNYEKHDIVCSIPVTGATGVDNIAADGTEAAAPAKKIVDGKLVIETANGTFNAAGAQVK